MEVLIFFSGREQFHTNHGACAADRERWFGDGARNLRIELSGQVDDLVEHRKAVNLGVQIRQGGKQQ